MGAWVWLQILRQDSCFIESNKVNVFVHSKQTQICQKPSQLTAAQPHTLSLSLSLTHTQQDKVISEWLRTLMSEGQSAIDRFIKNPVNNKQRLLAEHYQLAIQRAEEERTLPQ